MRFEGYPFRFPTRPQSNRKEPAVSIPEGVNPVRDALQRIALQAPYRRGCAFDHPDDQSQWCAPCIAVAALGTADPAPVGLTEDERGFVERRRAEYEHAPIGGDVPRLLAIIDRLVPVSPSVDPEEG